VCTCLRPARRRARAGAGRLLGAGAGRAAEAARRAPHASLAPPLRLHLPGRHRLPPLALLQGRLAPPPPPTRPATAHIIGSQWVQTPRHGAPIISPPALRWCPAHLARRLPHRLVAHPSRGGGGGARARRGAPRWAGGRQRAAGRLGCRHPTQSCASDASTAAPSLSKRGVPADGNKGVGALCHLQLLLRPQQRLGHLALRVVVCATHRKGARGVSNNHRLAQLCRRC
jgi:hypothetical protein